MRTNLADSPEWNTEDHAISQVACWGREVRHTVQVLVQGLPEQQGQHVAIANVLRNVSVLLEDVTLLQDLAGGLLGGGADTQSVSCADGVGELQASW